MKRVAALILLLTLSAKALAFSPFVVSDIRIEGLQRITDGTVLSYLPINKGDTLDNAKAQKAINALYQTGFFKDIKLQEENDILIVKVVERPSISSLNIHGNKAIKTKALKEGLKSIGLYEGATFDRLALDRVRKELIHEYYNRGKYSITITPHITHLDHNRVDIDIDISEGKTARIKQINIVGNTTYTDKQIRKDFKSDTHNWTSWYSKDDQYSNGKLSGDLDSLTSYYMDRGYADFDITSTQVAISPNKESMYITASIKEGDKYRIDDIKLVGKMVLPEEVFRQSVLVHKGDTFNRVAIQQSAKNIKGMLADIGYAFAKVTPTPKLDKENDTVSLTFHIQPGHRVYVRRITFTGNTRTEDQVLRREMRQMEGSWYSQAAIDRSKTRLSQLGYFKHVDIRSIPVPGSDDEIDLIVHVEEQQAGSLKFGVGYSQYAKVLLSASVSQDNLLGTGDKFSLGVATSRYQKSLNIHYLNPYITDSGISMGYNMEFSKTDFDTRDFANYRNNRQALSTFIGFPLNETDRLTFGAGVERNRLTLFDGYTPQSYLDYQKALGSNSSQSWTASVKYTHETRNSYWAPTRGGLQSIGLKVALPSSTVPYWKLDYRGSHYWPIGGGFVLNLNGNVGYGSTYGNTTYKNTAGCGNASKRCYRAGQQVDFPFWENYFAGGVYDVRGFQSSSLGPREKTKYYTNPVPLGGAFKVYANAQVFLPIPFLRDIQTARIAVFTDVGNVYKDYQSFDSSKLRASAGVALQWQAPIGPLVISYAVPVRKQKGDSHYTERFQFTFGSSF